MQSHSNIADELTQLQKLHAEGHLTRLEFEEAKRILLTKHSTPTQTATMLAAALAPPAAPTFEMELAVIEAEWAAARRKYMIRPKGQDERFAPKESVGGTIAVAVSFGGLAALITLLGLGHVGWLWLCAVATAGAPILYAVTSKYKMAYDAALSKYIEAKRALHFRYNRPL